MKNIQRNKVCSRNNHHVSMVIASIAVLFGFNAHTQAQFFNFANGDHDFTATASGTSDSTALFKHENGRWFLTGVEAGSGKFATATLTSPRLVVPTDGRLFVTLRHKFNFEQDWDSGQLLVSVEDGADQIAGDTIGTFLQDGHTKTLPTQGTNPHQGQSAWTGQSKGIIQSILRIEGLVPGGNLNLKLVANFDAATLSEPPNWEIFEIHVGEAPQTRTWIVDNDPNNINADFKNLQTAVDAAGLLDTLLVMPSLQSYGAVNVGKGVTIVGGGFGGAELFGEWHSRSTRTADINIVAGTSGLSLVGLDIRGTVKFLDRPRFTSMVTSNILLYRNLIDDPGSSTTPARSIIVGTDEHNGRGAIQNLFVINNWIVDYVDMGVDFEFWHTDGAYFLNNVIRSHFQLYASDSSSHAIVSNNIFPNRWQNIWIDEGSFVNNIVVRDNKENDNSGYFSHQSAIVSNNIFVGAQPFKVNGGLTSLTDPNLILKTLSEVVDGEGEWWKPWVLIEESPAINFGDDGSDAGIFGGAHPWDLEQKPPMPFIRSVEGPSVVTEGENLEINVIIESNE